MFKEILIFPCKLSSYPKNKDGYAIIYVKGKRIREHRYIYSKHFKIILTPKQVVMHKCDNPPCTEITHLKLGTHKDNSNDMVAKNRQAKGESLGRLTEKEVLEIRKKYSPIFYTQCVLAREYHVSQMAISKIVNRKSWAHI